MKCWNVLYLLFTYRQLCVGKIEIPLGVYRIYTVIFYVEFFFYQSFRRQYVDCFLHYRNVLCTTLMFMIFQNSSDCFQWNILRFSLLSKVIKDLFKNMSTSGHFAEYSLIFIFSSIWFGRQSLLLQFNDIRCNFHFIFHNILVCKNWLKVRLSTHVLFVVYLQSNVFLINSNWIDIYKVVPFHISAFLAQSQCST